MRRVRYSDEELRAENPRLGAGFLSVITFWYTLKVFRMGNRADLTEEDLMKPLPEHKSGMLADKMCKVWSNEVRRAKLHCISPSLLKVIFKCFYCEFLFYGVLMFIMEIIIRVQQPIFIGLLIKYFDPNNKLNENPEGPPRYLMRIFYYWSKDQCAIDKSEAIVYAVGVFLCSAVVTLITHPNMLGVMHIGMKIRVACCSLIYRKVLRLSLTSLGGKIVGTAVNLVSNDVNRFDISPLFLHYVWISPLQAVLVLYFLYKEIEMSAFVGILAIVVFIPLQGWLGASISIFRHRTAERTDDRVKEMNEIIRGIQVIKMYAWEDAFVEKIHHSRQRELSTLKYMNYIRGMLMSFLMFVARLGIFLSVVSYIRMGNEITAENVFVITGYYQILRQTMTMYFPQGIASIAETSVAISRIQNFLMSPEAEVGDPTPIDPDIKEKGVNQQMFRAQLNAIARKMGIPLGVVVENVTAKYDNVVVLENINLTAVPGQVTTIIGQVGSGKTCLLNLILGELLPSKGTVDCYGSISYASQEPWLYVASVRDNILFGQDYNRTRYREVVRVCALARDFTLFPYGDRTLVGERGVSLSGGQRARVNLARAIYKEADIYLLDDPLSAVDPQVGQHLFTECITQYLAEKVVILVTHQLQYLQRVPQIVIMDHGRIVMKGNYTQLKSSGLNVTDFLGSQEQAPQEGKSKVQNVLNQIPITSTMGLITLTDMEKGPQEVSEIRTTGSVKTEIYCQYLKAGGNCLTMLIMFILFFLAQIIASYTDYFLAYWVKLHQYYDSNPDQFGKKIPIDEFIDYYSILIAATAISTVVRSFYFFKMAVRSSLKLHDKMFYAVIKATMYFFNTNPSGRILNRFSKDLGSVDEFLPNAMIDTFQIFLNLAGLAVVVAAVHPIFLAPIVVIVVLCYVLRACYIKTSRSIKRLDGITRSPVFSHLNATVQGLTTVRSHRQEVLLAREFDEYQDIHSTAWYLFICTSRAFGYWLDCICVIFIGVVIWILFLMQDDIYGSDAGLCITQCIGITGLFQWGMRQSAELENQMTSVERVLEFTKIEQEPPLISTRKNKPPYFWPPRGEINFRNLSMRYNVMEPPVLKNLTIFIKAQEKVGIVGRTGAGKSSIIAALFRLAYIDGELIIDNVDVTKIGLHDLRRKISIIPQEPVLFSGSLRYNLDPFQEYSDEALLSSLQTVELKFSEYAGKACLEAIITEGGANISVGHRQLICLSRAILKNNKILVLDEATANVDAVTDRFIQTTIRTRFSHCTVLTIAHRLNTIMDSDKVLVVDAGTIVEFDHAHELLRNKFGYFSAMVQKTGPVMEQQLKEIAKKDFEEKAKRRPTDADSASIASTVTIKSENIQRK